MSENKVYPAECRIEHTEKIVEMLEKIPSDDPRLLQALEALRELEKRLDIHKSCIFS